MVMQYKAEKSLSRQSDRQKSSLEGLINQHRILQWCSMKSNEASECRAERCAAVNTGLSTGTGRTLDSHNINIEHQRSIIIAVKKSRVKYAMSDSVESNTKGRNRVMPSSAR